MGLECAPGEARREVCDDAGIGFLGYVFARPRGRRQHGLRGEIMMFVTGAAANKKQSGTRRRRPRKTSWIARRFWRDLEIVLRWIFLDARERQTDPLASSIRAPIYVEPRPRRRREVLVAGRAAFTDGLLRCLMSEDFNVHAIAADPDARRALLAMGATPHLFHQIADQASRFDVVVSTDLMQYIGAEFLALLPEHAVVLDLAPTPGSVDYESAKKLGRKVIWARSRVSEGQTVFSPEIWGKVRRVLDACNP
jgi:hypothetical protein